MKKIIEINGKKYRVFKSKVMKTEDGSPGPLLIELEEVKK